MIYLDFSICMQLDMEKVKHFIIDFDYCFTCAILKFLQFSRKGILQDIVKYTDFTTEKFLEIHIRVLKAVDGIKPIEEYRDFIGKHKYICNIIIFVSAKYIFILI